VLDITEALSNQRYSCLQDNLLWYGCGGDGRFEVLSKLCKVNVVEDWLMEYLTT